MRPHLWKLFGACCLLVLAAVSAGWVMAQDNVPAPTDEARASFVYSLGHTTLVEARDYWLRNGKILGAGHLSLGTGSGVDGFGGAAAQRVILVDVSGIDFEGIPAARFGFYDGTLYLIQARLRPMMKVRRSDSTDQDFTDDQLAALEARLRQEHGRPTASHRSIFAHKGQGDDVLAWTIDGNTLTYTKSVKTLVLTNEKTQASIRTYVKAYCKTVNTRDRIVCW